MPQIVSSPAPTASPGARGPVPARPGIRSSSSTSVQCLPTSPNPPSVGLWPAPPSPGSPPFTTTRSFQFGPIFVCYCFFFACFPITFLSSPSCRTCATSRRCCPPPGRSLLLPSVGLLFSSPRCNNIPDDDDRPAFVRPLPCGALPPALPGHLHFHHATSRPSRMSSTASYPSGHRPSSALPGPVMHVQWLRAGRPASSRSPLAVPSAAPPTLSQPGSFGYAGAPALTGRAVRACDVHASGGPFWVSPYPVAKLRRSSDILHRLRPRPLSCRQARSFDSARDDGQIWPRVPPSAHPHRRARAPDPLPVLQIEKIRK